MRSLWLPVSSSVAVLTLGASLWPAKVATTSPSALDVLLQRLQSLSLASGDESASSPSDAVDPKDLVVANLSVQRIRYERATDQTHGPPHPLGESASLVRTLFGDSAWVMASLQTSTAEATRAASVVVAWDEYGKTPWTAGRQADGTQQDKELAQELELDQDQEQGRRNDKQHDVEYEVQMWVNGWGFDVFWHPANRRVVTRDPFVVLHDLPQDQELGFRVRLRVLAPRGVLLSGLFAAATAIEGPWSAPVTLAPAREQAMEAIRAFLLANKAFGAVLALCIGLSVAIILRLACAPSPCGSSFASSPNKSAVASSSSSSSPSSSSSLSASSSPSLLVTSSQDKKKRRGKLPSVARANTVPPRRASRHASSGAACTCTCTATTSTSTSLRWEVLAQEVTDLRQELADSEAEVRRLMLLRGYGVDELTSPELDALERELRQSLQLVYKQRRLREQTVFESLDETEEEEEEVEDGEDNGEEEDEDDCDGQQQLQQRHCALV